MSSLARILTDNYFDSVRAEFVKENNVITIDKTNGLILGVSKALDASDPPPADVEVIDLRGLTVMPGFVDTHVHCGSLRAASWSDQVTRESVTERTIRAVNHAKATLMAGFTTVRDLGTEGAGDADIGLRKCISSPVSIIPGPRYFCASRAIVTTGSYGPKTQLHPNAQSVDGVSGAQVADGPAECSRVVRQHIGAGVYGDYSHRFRAAQTAPIAGNRPHLLWKKDEWDALVTTAHTAGVKVAVHANTAEAALAAINAGANSLEHGYGYNEEVFAKLRGGRVVWNPTLSVFNLEPDTPKWASLQAAFQLALKENAKVSHNPMSGIPIAVGGDTGPFAHGTNAGELKLMHSLGMPAVRVLQSATLVGWRCVRSMDWDTQWGEQRLSTQMKEAAPMGDNEVPFGYLARGFAADIIATSGNLVGDNEQGFDDAVSSENIVFVMKAGKVYKTGGKPVV
ncbi:amidohydrolase family domain-containing protein [Rhizoctonia solani AG-1 IA]|uniref:Amidohydrolase family domain-containing protein n=1 Tax=Thanatephorus cucumeris (strain AG1-IA) TaxID=983506 RepID=L8X4E8_THACA|nr:amidohydrolase family domain-containing protein [Rhizoctonia solani AG-1 IA]